jgi:hypothetical protein
MEYHGNAHKVLLQTIDELHARPVEHNYAKIIHITQSSGTGKSKTVDMVAMERILFPICLREDLGEQFLVRDVDCGWLTEDNHICSSISSPRQSSPRPPC